MPEEQDRESKLTVVRRQLVDLRREMQECADQMEASEESAGNKALPVWLATLRDPEQACEMCDIQRPPELMRMPRKANELFDRYVKLRRDRIQLETHPLIDPGDGQS